MTAVALLDEDPSLTPDGETGSSSSGARRMVIVLLLAAAVAAGYFLFSSSSEPEPVVAERDAPAPAPEPEPDPEPEPPPEPVRRAPRPAPPPEPKIEPEPLPPPTNVLRVTSDVDGAQVFLDRRFLGYTPLDLADLDAGMHQVNVAAEGYDGIAQTIEISDAPVELRIEFRLVRLDQAIDVVHKHRFGSCRGRLVANLQGFHYQTDDDDAFSVPLDQVEAFALDYPDHTLHLKVRGGRDYNFTDEQATADPLFVFHRDVEKARTRLAQGDRPATGGE